MTTTSRKRRPPAIPVNPPESPAAAEELTTAPPPLALDPELDPDHNPDERPEPDEDEARGVTVCRNPDCPNRHVHRRGLCWACYRDPELRRRFPAYSRYTRDKRLWQREVRYAPAVPYEPLSHAKIDEMTRRAEDRRELFSPRDGAHTRGVLAFAARMPLGARVSYLRRQLAWTVAHLARRAGLDESLVWHVEHGRRRPSLANRRKLALALGVDPELLLHD